MSSSISSSCGALTHTQPSLSVGITVTADLGVVERVAVASMRETETLLEGIGAGHQKSQMQLRPPPSVQRTRSGSANRYAINQICSCLHLCEVHSRRELVENLKRFSKLLNDKEQLFTHLDSRIRYAHFKEAIKVYNSEMGCSIVLQEDDYSLFKDMLASCSQIEDPLSDDLGRVTQNYDRLINARQRLDTSSKQLRSQLLASESFSCPKLILGAGDAATSLWLESHRADHTSVQHSMERGCNPDVMMIADGFGNWKNDYALAQPHSILERAHAPSNPADFIGKEYYRSNPRVNARHLYQSNLTILSETNAPLLQGAKVVAIETWDNHRTSWDNSRYQYRVLVELEGKIKTIYTGGIDFCTGLGPAKEVLAGKAMSNDDFQRLRQFHPEKGFTPIVDGNELILTDRETARMKPRRIVIYGGGGAALAAYRKTFFGHDVRTETLPFDEKHRQNKTLWVSRQESGFRAAGQGQSAKHSLDGAKQLKELVLGDLVRIEEAPSGELRLHVAVADGKTDVIVCDQLVECTGQDFNPLKTLCRELESDLILETDPDGMILGLTTTDRKVHFIGAAAFSMRQIEFFDASQQWIDRENIGPDSTPSTMPPTRAQIRRASPMVSIESVNVNNDPLSFLRSFLEQAGVESGAAEKLLSDIFASRRDTTAGLTHATLAALLRKHGLEDQLAIAGHAQLVKRFAIL